MKFYMYFVIVIAFLDTFSQLPIMSPYAYSLGATPLLAGMIVGMYSFSNMIGNIISGDFIDRIGTKKVIFFGLCITALTILLYPITANSYQLLLVRFLHGLSAGFLVPAAFTFLGNEANEGEQGKTMAKSGAAIGISAIIGPAFSSMMLHFFEIKWIFYVISIAMIISMIFAKFMLPNQIAKPSNQAEKITISDLIELLKNKFILNAYLGSFSLMFTLGILSYMLPLKVESLLLSNSLTGMLLSTFGIVAIIFFLLPTNKLFDTIDHQKGMLIGLSIISIALLLLSIFTTKGLMFIAMSVYGLGFAFLFPSTSAIIVEQSKPEDRGKAFGLFYAFFSLGVVFGSFSVGALAATPALGFLTGSLGCLIMTIIIFYRVNKVPIKLENH